MRGRRPSIDRAGSEGDDRRCLEVADILWLHYFLEKVMEPFTFLLTVAHFVSQRSRFFNGSRERDPLLDILRPATSGIWPAPARHLHLNKCSSRRLPF